VAIGEVGGGKGEEQAVWAVVERLGADVEVLRVGLQALCALARVCRPGVCELVERCVGVEEGVEGVVTAKLAVGLLVRGPQGVRRRVRSMQKVVAGVQAVLDRCVVEADEERGCECRQMTREQTIGVPQAGCHCCCLVFTMEPLTSPYRLSRLIVSR
jgi:hypothetical protein